MKGTNSRSSRTRAPNARDASIALGLIVLIVALLLLGGCSQGESTGTPASSVYRNADSQIEAMIPGGWRALHRPITSVIYPPQVLAAASFPAQVPRRPPNCSPGRVLAQMPPGGVFLQVFEYAAEASGRPVRVPDLPPRPARFRYADADYGPFECAGYSYKFAFEQGGRAFQAHVWLERKGTDPARRAEALEIVIGFWSDTLRRVDPGTLEVRHTLKLRLPFELVAGDRDFLPFDVAANAVGVWVSTARGVLAKADPLAKRVVGTVRLPFDATGEIEAGAGAVWVAEQLAGVYRVGPGSNRVVARIRVGPRLMPIAVQDVAVVGDDVFALGVRTAKGRVATAYNVLARIDSTSARVEAIEALPPGPARLAAGLGALACAARSVHGPPHRPGQWCGDRPAPRRC